MYNFVQCPTKVQLDRHGDPSRRDELSDFAKMLWEQGISHEEATAINLPITINIDDVPHGLRAQATLDAMARKEPMIFHGVIGAGDLVGQPDLLMLRNGGYVPGDIKSGSGFEGVDDEAKVKKHYCVQVAHYVNILEAQGLSDGSRTAVIVDRTGAEVVYDLNAPRSPTVKETWWDVYQHALSEVRGIVAGATNYRPALSSACKLCDWGTHCRETLISAGDLTLVAELGRSKRDAMIERIPTIQALASIVPSSFVNPSDKKKTIFPGIGPDTLQKFHVRAKLLVEPGSSPILKKEVELPQAANIVLFDLEGDPFRDVIYLHGFVQQKNDGSGGQFLPQLAERPDDEHEAAAFAAAWRYLTARAEDSVVYYYSPYERTAYKKLAKKYGWVCTPADVEAFFALRNVVDLYAIVKKHTEWPTYDQSIKSLAKPLGFAWRDTNPSGAASIEWYHRWVESRDAAIRQRLLDYNEDDCLAMGVVLQGIRALCAQVA
jgi:uncharacterized protein